MDPLDELVQVNLRMPAWLRDAANVAAKMHDRTLSAEMRVALIAHLDRVLPAEDDVDAELVARAQGS